MEAAACGTAGRFGEVCQVGSSLLQEHYMFQVGGVLASELQFLAPSFFQNLHCPSRLIWKRRK